LGRKVHPIGFRLGIVKEHKSRWFAAGKQYTTQLAEDRQIRAMVFADLVGFTPLAHGMLPGELVRHLDELFSRFDALAERAGVEKIKTIGDAYMVVGGLTQPRPDHTAAVVAFAVDMLAVIGRHHGPNGEPIGLRIGINTGPIVAGVIGRRRLIYDLWGDTVNTASRMESFGLENRIQVTPAVVARLNGHYHFEPRGPIDIKGKGMMTTYLLRPE